VHLLRRWEKDEGLPHVRVAGRAVVVAVGVVYVYRTLVRIFLSNGCTFCLEWWPSITVVRYWLFPVLWLVTDCNGCQLVTDVTDGVSFWLAVTVALIATVTVRWPPSTRVYIRRWGCFWWRQHNEQSQTHCTQSFPSHLLRAQSVEEHASEIVVRRATLARVCGQSYFWGAYSRLLASSAQSSLVNFLGAGTVWGTALRASDCIDCVRLNIHSRCLVWMESLIPSASIPP
jgi:hypothetical protein